VEEAGHWPGRRSQARLVSGMPEDGRAVAEAEARGLVQAGASEFEARWPRRQVGEDRSAEGERGWSLSAAGARVIAARI
jgi:hypothetical protein